MNPECRDGKHANCDGSAWDDEADELTSCTCQCHVEELRPFQDAINRMHDEYEEITGLKLTDWRKS